MHHLCYDKFCRSKYRSNDRSFAIATLARYRAKKLTGQRLRSAGIKVSTVRYCDLRMQPDRYLAEHRDESWPGRRRLKRKSRHSNNRRRPANQELRLCKCREQNDDHRLCPREHTSLSSVRGLLATSLATEKRSSTRVTRFPSQVPCRTFPNTADAP